MDVSPCSKLTRNRRSDACRHDHRSARATRFAACDCGKATAQSRKNPIQADYQGVGERSCGHVLSRPSTVTICKPGWWLRPAYCRPLPVIQRIRQNAALISCCCRCWGFRVQPKVRKRPETRIVKAITEAVARTATCRMRNVREVPSKSLCFPPTGGGARSWSALRLQFVPPVSVARMAVRLDWARCCG